MTDWVYIEALLSAGLLIFLLWKENKRVNRGRLGWRIIATVISVVALCCTALPITYQTTRTNERSNEAILLTEGYDTDTLSGLLRNHKGLLPLLTMEENIAAAKNNITLLKDPADLSSGNYSSIHIVGYGVPKELSDQIHGTPIVFHATPLPTGITHISWQKKLSSGNKLIVQGKLNNTGTSSAKVIVSDFHTILDSFTCQPKQSASFQLTTIPKQLGRAVYALSVVANRDTLEKEAIAFETTPVVPLKILLLSSSPDFENKFLKNWLSEKGYEVVVRTTISKNKIAKEFLNTPAVALEQITAGLLTKFDVIIADATELAAIGREQEQLIRSAVQSGKGLIIKADSAAARNAFYAAQFPLSPAPPDAAHSVTLRLAGNTADTFASLVSDQPLFIRAQNGTRPLVTDRAGNVMANSAISGAGKIILVTLPNTFSWMLSGNQPAYDGLWSELLNNALVKNTGAETWQISPSLPVVNEKTRISVAHFAGGTQAQVNGSGIYLAADPQQSFLQSGMYWPVKEGWQTVIRSNGQSFYWYAYHNTRWKYVHAAENIRNTKQVSDHIDPEKAQNENITTSRREPFPAIVFFVLFLLGCGYLWFENKYYNR